MKIPGHLKEQHSNESNSALFQPVYKRLVVRASRSFSENLGCFRWRSTHDSSQSLYPSGVITTSNKPNSLIDGEAQGHVRITVSVVVAKPRSSARRSEWIKLAGAQERSERSDFLGAQESSDRSDLPGVRERSDRSNFPGVRKRGFPGAPEWSDEYNCRD